MKMTKEEFAKTYTDKANYDLYCMVAIKFGFFIGNLSKLTADESHFHTVTIGTISERVVLHLKRELIGFRYLSKYDLEQIIEQLDPDAQDYEKTTFIKASEAVIALESGAELYANGKDDRFYKLTTAPAVCKHHLKGTLYTKREPSFAELVIRELGDEWGCMQIGEDDRLSAWGNKLSDNDWIELAQAITKAAGETQHG